MVQNLDVIKIKALPILKEANVSSAYIFGSHARGEATEFSDIDLLIDYGASTKSMFELSELKYKLAKALNKSVDLVSTNSLRNDYFSKQINKDKICILGE
ncbi:nucleotidyltransferase family protein [Veillonella criceti]|uniref:Predicted nucleotidyltransferases n=1 Tax=Veillonella criceti TaxID=103891 RepID=A0A380NE37_9FIRM|nr:nucleotidyltransferase domain-containing protein [Veillonella criceti]SUP37134.1 Predicted nucleotidyltransferases [Veillonella criceti]